MVPCSRVTSETPSSPGTPIPSSRLWGDAQIGDAIRLELTYGTYVYEISNIEIKSNTDESILAPSEEQILTLYTYYPFDYIGNTPDRYVVTAKLVEGKSLSEINFEGAS